MPAYGGYNWSGSNNAWMVFNNEMAPMILNVAAKTNYANFATFQTDITNNALSVTSTNLTYEGIQNAGTLTFYMEMTNPIAPPLPKINGSTVDLMPDYTFKSPFLNEAWADGNVYIQKDARAKECNFKQMRAWLKLDESSGSTAFDYTENGADGVLSGNPSWSSDQGILGGALQFNGSNDYVYCGTTSSLASNTDFTVSAWIKTSAATEQTVVQQRDTGYNGEYWMRVGTNGRVNFAVYSSGYQFNFYSSTVVNDGVWHHIAVARKGLTGYIYVDGLLNGQATGTSIQSLNAVLGVVLGADIYGTHSKHFNGLMDDVRIYSAFIGDDQINDIYLRDRVFAWWKLDNQQGDMTGDSAVANCTGTLHGNPVWWPDSGKVDGCIELNGSGDYINFGTGASLDGSVNFTVAAWVRTSASLDQTVIQQRDARYDGEYWLRVRSDGKVNFAIYNSAYQFNFNSTSAVNDGQWHHIAVSRKGLNGYIFIDGQLNAQITGASVQDLNSEIGVILGADTLGNTKYFSGSIDDVRIFKTSLTSNSVYGIYSGQQ
jgi:hypothetical protein